jgi:uncharacterized Zn-binding protein involved in type VI secretion
MRIPVVRDGDPTTTGGTVIALKATIHNRGKKIALHGEHATCGNCEGSWPMFGTGEKMSNRGTHVVIEGDHVLCPCGKNRVVAGPDVSCFIHKDTGASSAAASRPLRESHEVAKCDEQYTLMSLDGRRIASVRYRIVTDRGRVFTGTTNGLGETERIATDGKERLRLYTTGATNDE